MSENKKPRQLYLDQIGEIGNAFEFEGTEQRPEDWDDSDPDYSVHVIEYSAYKKALDALREIGHHLSSLEHSIKRHSEVDKEKIALVKIIPEVSAIRKALGGANESKG